MSGECVTPVYLLHVHTLSKKRIVTNVCMSLSVPLCIPSVWCTEVRELSAEAVFTVGLYDDVDDVVEAGLPLSLRCHVGALLQGSWEGLESVCVVESYNWYRINIFLDYSESRDRIWENRPLCTLWTQKEVGRAECRKRREEFFGTSCCFSWTAQYGVFISWKVDTGISLSYWYTLRGMCSLCFIQNKNSKHYHQ